MKLREMRLRNYLQHTEKRNQVRHSWRLRGLGGEGVQKGIAHWDKQNNDVLVSNYMLKV